MCGDIPSAVAKRMQVAPNGCWLWSNALDRDGYGRIQIGGVTRRAHRWTYELLEGAIPDGLQIDHLCRNRGCVNPDHLEPVTARENAHRGETVQANNAAKSRCSSGHELSGANLYQDPRGWRGCLACRRAAVAKSYAKRRA